MPDRFDHLDRDGLVELALKIPVVVEQHGDAIRQALGGDFFDRVVVLRARDRGGGDAASVVLGRVNRKPAPSRADLDEVIAGAKIELAADRMSLGVAAASSVAPARSKIAREYMSVRSR